MAQFKVFTSGAPGAPLFYGTTGSMVALLDYCLYSGSGWLKPLANSGSATFPNSLGCYKQPTGSGMTLYINDAAPNGTALYKEAWATGWENLLGMNSPVGSGSGQFPTPAQLLTTGHTVIRKSTTSDSSSLRSWIVVADSSSFMSFIQTGDVASTYFGFGFGDIYSFKTGSYDQYKCIILGRNAENTAASANDGFDYFSTYAGVVGGNFMPRSYTQLGTSITLAKHGDSVKGNASFYLGVVPMPNASDNALYISPVWVVEVATSTIRGQLRGIYQPLHPIASFSDGQIFSGSLDYNGRTFFVIKTTPNSGMYVIETSNTLPTN